MRTFLRRLRGVTVTALLWAFVWAFIGALLIAFEVIRHGGNPTGPIGLAFLAATTSFGILGAFSGSVFAVVLALLERRRTLEDLSMRRVAAWGAIGGMALPILGVVTFLSRFSAIPLEDLVPVVVLGAVMAVLGAACSTATVALARRPVPTLDPV